MNPPGRHRTPLLTLAALLAQAGCAPGPASFDSTDPQARTIALARAAADPEDSDIPEMITLLGSIDPAQRMLAIRGLERQTGQTLGYVHYGPEPERRAAQQRWVSWWAERSGGATPTAMGDTR